MDQPIGAEVRDNGKFSFDPGALRPGRYYVSLPNRAKYHIDRVAAGGAQLKGRSIEVAAGDDPSTPESSPA